MSPNAQPLHHDTALLTIKKCSYFRTSRKVYHRLLVLDGNLFLHHAALSRASANSVFLIIIIGSEAAVLTVVGISQIIAVFNFLFFSYFSI